MIGGKKVLGVIPARGGSKGVPRKNIRDLGGKPLIAWTIEAAKACPHIDRLVLSSEDEEIMAVAREWGCEVPFPRPKELAGDNTLAIDVALHLLESLQERYEFMVWLQPTSPLRSSEDITRCLELCLEEGVPGSITVCDAGKSPYWMYEVEASGNMTPILKRDITGLQRQDLPQAYTLNGAVHVARVDYVLNKRKFPNGNSKAYIMPPNRSIDIDTELDFKIAALLKEEEDQVR
ncbi:MAG: acylneuraminate cytidylyltransferase family protein [Magnetococcales bacterium]|nr:acylneuraminate cytidylyltransferase family protein [Magnetococcales bacterium]